MSLSTDNLLGRAFEIAFGAHRGQTDKSGAPYIAHVVRVAAGTTSAAGAVAALLHDVVEDTDISLEHLAAEFPTEIVAAVDALTRRSGEAPETYYERVRADTIATEVKLADIADNAAPARLGLLDPETRARLEAKYADARRKLGAA